jgi:para-aminobenzoate synthetase/4-amino-4-deoxychorismate lyase
VSLYNLFKSLFPSGSVTGAPKIRAMEIIHELEREPRNIYTGAIGYIKPNKDFFMNIPIRTALINKTNGKSEMGIGGGIVWDSTAEGEWAEGILKAKFFTSLESPAACPARSFTSIGACNGNDVSPVSANKGFNAPCESAR